MKIIFRSTPCSSWIRNNKQQTTSKQKPNRINLFPIIAKENLTEAINVPGPPI